MALVQKLLSPVVEMRKEESTTALLMFAYSFLVMWAYNVIRPITRSAFIKDPISYREDGSYIRVPLFSVS